MPDRAVVNASPLILLAKAGHLELLRALGRELMVPDAVVEARLVYHWHQVSRPRNRPLSAPARARNRSEKDRLRVAKKALVS